MFILEPSEQAKAAIGKRVTVVDHPDGRLSIRYRGVELAYRTFDKLHQVPQAAVVENMVGSRGSVCSATRSKRSSRSPREAK
jgi:hypothetical protein